jgi:hypothetical protein
MVINTVQSPFLSDFLSLTLPYRTATDRSKNYRKINENDIFY